MRMSNGLVPLAIAALSFLLTAGPTVAGDENTIASGGITALDANQGSGVQVNADSWEDMGTVLAGQGSQSSDTGGSANTGSGSQNGATVDSDDWAQIDNANSGTGSQIGSSSNSNGNDRISNDLLTTAGNDSSVASGDLAASVSGNSVLTSGQSINADSELLIDAESGFFGLSGINAVAAESGTNSSQNVGINVTASVQTGGSSL